MNWENTVQRLVEAVLFGAIGIALFFSVFKAIVRGSPFSIRKEIEEDQNTALAVLVGSIFIGIALIVAAAMHG
jgi:putative membrane protein